MTEEEDIKRIAMEKYKKQRAAVDAEIRYSEFWEEESRRLRERVATYLKRRLRHAEEK